MAYEKVRSVTYERNGGAFIIESAENNIRPLTYTRWVFSKGMRAFIRNICGRLFQIRPSANGYYWANVNTAFTDALSRKGLTTDEVYGMDDNDPRWDMVVSLYQGCMDETDRARRTMPTVTVRYGEYYIADRCPGNRQFCLTSDRSNAMRMKPLQALYLSRRHGYAIEQ